MDNEQVWKKNMEGIMKNWDQITPLPTPSQNMQVNEYIQIRSSCKKKISVNCLHYLKEKKITLKYSVSLEG